MILQFDVINQRIVRKDNNYVVANSQFYLQMDFNFTQDWYGFGKTITFVGSGKKYSLGLTAQDSCVVPYDVIKTPSFSFSIKGLKDDVIITTNVCVVSINASGETKGVAPVDPPKDILSGLQNGLKGQVLGKLSDDNYDFEFQNLKDLQYDDEHTLSDILEGLIIDAVTDVKYENGKLQKQENGEWTDIVEMYDKDTIDTMLANLDKYIEKSDTPGLVKNDGTIDETQYESQDDLNTAKTDLQGDINDLDTKLSQDISNEENARIAAISNEATARENADALLTPKTRKVGGVSLENDTNNLQDYIYDTNQTLKQKIDAMNNDISGKQAQLSQTQLDATNSGIDSTKVGDYDSHLANTNNPHEVTKTQVGLGNVNDTSDSPTPEENGTQKFTTGGAYTLKSDLHQEVVDEATARGNNDTRIEGKIDNHIADVSNPHSVTKAQVGLGNVANTGDNATPSENGIEKFTTGGAYTLKTNLEQADSAEANIRDTNDDALASAISGRICMFTLPPEKLVVSNWGTSGIPQEFENYSYVAVIRDPLIIGAKSVNVLFTITQILSDNYCPAPLIDDVEGTIKIFGNDNITITLNRVEIFKDVEYTIPEEE